jgi:hypothetical protein
VPAKVGDFPTMVTSFRRSLAAIEYMYAVLPAWGMHRMGQQRECLPFVAA